MRKTKNEEFSQEVPRFRLLLFVKARVVYRLQAKLETAGYKPKHLAVDEFAIQMLMEYDGKHFVNVCKDDLDLSTDAEKEAMTKKNEDAKGLLDKMKEALDGKVTAVKLTNKLGSHPVCLSAEGYVSLEMEKVLNSMPGANQGVKAQLVLEVNADHPIVEKLKSVDDDTLKKYTNLLYSSARLIAGLDLENPTEFSDNLAQMM